MTTPPSFSDFFAAIHGVRPFHWQARFAAECVAGRLPSTLTVPTGCGKTAVLDAFVYAMACGPSGAAARMARRVFFVVDRRVVVDAAHERAQRICDALAAATQGPLAWVADRLRALSGDPQAPPLLAVRLRGGVPADDAWTRDPAQPTLISSTVDQVGSRLLFRGYGVSPRAAPIHAGLVGQDALVVLDEVHLSPAFAATLDRARDYGSRRWRVADSPVPPLHVLQMSATPPHADAVADGAAPGPLAFDATPDLDADPALAARLDAPRRVLLKKCAAKKGDDPDGVLQKGLVDAWVQLRKLRPEATASAILVNRVERARAVFHAARAALGPDDDALLIIGRARPVDADELRARLLPRLQTGWDRRAPRAGHLLVVATQTLEAGADLDFDLLVSEAAAGDALRQRFGRLDRAGAAFAAELPAAQPTPPAAPPAPGGQLSLFGGPAKGASPQPTPSPAAAEAARASKPRGAVVYIDNLHKEDILYKKAIKAAWADLEQHAEDAPASLGWIPGAGAKPAKGKAPAAGVDAAEPADKTEGWSKAVVDFGLRAQRGWALSDEVRAPRPPAPTLLPAHLDHASQTAPPAHPLLDPAPFLHAPDAAPPPVRLVWRADITEGLLRAEPESAIDRVAALPPVAAEVLEVGIGAFRRWIRGGAQRGPVGNDHQAVDIEGAPSRDDDEPSAEASAGGRAAIAASACVRWDGVDDSAVVSLDEARPGDLLVLPAALGGADAFGWDPSHRGPVIDRAEWAPGRRSARPALRVHPAAVAAWADAPPPPAAAALALDDAPERRVRAWLDALAQHATLPEPVRARARLIARAPRLSWLGRDSENAHLLVEGPPRASATDDLPLDAASDAPSLLGVGEAVALTAHSTHVRDEAARIAAALGLAAPLAADLALAGHLHDLGKADPRFQALLAGAGPDPLAESTTLLAKSARGTSQRAADRRARARSGLPRGFRHEALSLDFAEAWLRAHPGAAHDPDLVLHLVAAHHGHARPSFPVVEDRRPPEVHLAWEGTALRARHRDHAQVDDPTGARFRALQARYGWHGLAHLEACLRLADHRASAREAQGTPQ